MKNDVFVPLINPGEIRIEGELLKLFPASTIEETKLKWNEHVKDRHLNWSENDYIKREQELIEILGTGKDNWRHKRFSQCKKLVGENIGFMHTIEFFPFHSKNWNVKQEVRENWLFSLKSTELAINAIEEISINHLVKHIMGIGKIWADILVKYKDKFILEDYVELRGPKGGIAHRFYKFKSIKFSDAMPIVIYSGSSMNFPSIDEKATKIMREFLEI